MLSFGLLRAHLFLGSFPAFIYLRPVTVFFCGLLVAAMTYFLKLGHNNHGLIFTVVTLGLLQAVETVGLLRAVETVGLLRAVETMGFLRAVETMGLLRAVSSMGLIRAV